MDENVAVISIAMTKAGKIEYSFGGPALNRVTLNGLLAIAAADIERMMAEQAKKPQIVMTDPNSIPNLRG